MKELEIINQLVTYHLSNPDMSNPDDYLNDDVREILIREQYQDIDLKTLKETLQALKD